VSPRKVTAAGYSANIDGAEKASRPPSGIIDVGGVGGLAADALLRIARPRPAAEVEPVDTSLINGRRPEWWEAVLIIKARHRERARELTQLDGTR
jgi:hypothetical protein